MDFLTQIGLPLVLLTIMLFGLFSLVLLPILPGLVIIWAAALAYGLLTGFASTTGIVLFVVITLLMIAGSVVDNFLMGASAHKTGASMASVTVALVAGMIGSFFLPLFGGILLSLVALFALEYFRRRSLREALISTRGMAMGCGWAVVLRFVMGLVMIGLYAAWAWWV
jgi:uncharacterized protein YqgC (DUF456 family)